MTPTKPTIDEILSDFFVKQGEVTTLSQLNQKYITAKQSLLQLVLDEVITWCEKTMITSDEESTAVKEIFANHLRQRAREVLG